jgi:glycolate oxidase iron-sulfur subunit
MEQTRETLANEGAMTPTWQRLAMKPLASPKLLAAGTAALGVAQRLRILPDRLGVSGEIPLRQAPLPATGDDVYFFTGCVMDTMQRDVHRAGAEVLTAAGFGVTPTNDLAPCCGALQAHAGLTDETRSLATRMMDNLAGDTPVVVDSAGCGAAMKEYGHLLGTDEATAFSARVFDIQEFLADHLDKLPEVKPLDIRVAVQDPCHLRHVQRVHQATRLVLRPFVRELVELDDDGLCCGAGGAYSIFEPELAGQIRDRKVAAIDRATPDLVASANPGCSMHLGAVGVPTRHPMQIVHDALFPTS